LCADNNSPQGSEVDGFGDDDSGGVTVLKYTVHGCGAWRDSPHGRGCAGGVIQRCCLNGSDGGGSSVGGGSGGGGGYWPTSESGGVYVFVICIANSLNFNAMATFETVDHAAMNDSIVSLFSFH